MTFKHVKFEDSPTMRSLERVAKEKGLVKSEPMVKQAAKQEDLAPTADLMTNVLKLCDGLRKAGMDKYADEVETNFLNYKQAQTLYETSKEKGEDLVHDAHPKGSHKLEGVEGEEATVEDIIDQHSKIEEVATKEPKATLASSLDILKAVKVALADDPGTGLTQPVIDWIQSSFKNTQDAINESVNLVGINSDGVVAFNRLKANMYKHMNAHTITDATINQLIGTIDEAISGFSTREAGNLWMRGDRADKAIFQLKQLKNYMNDTVRDDHRALAAVVADEARKAEEKKKGDESDPVAQFTKRVGDLIKRLGTYKNLMTSNDFTDNDRNQMNPKIDAKLSELQAMQGEVDRFKDDQDAQRMEATRKLSKLPAYEAWAQKLNQWMNS